VTGAELVIVWALFALAIFGVPAYWVGWWNGRRCLRADLAAAPPPRPPRVLEVRLLAPEAEPFTVPALLWSEQQAAIDAHDREVRAMIDAAEARVPRRWR
jgi:hypothetical protein